MTRLEAALRDQVVHCAALGSPFMARLLTLLADRLRPDCPIRERLFAWEGDLSPQGHSVPLRLAGALHALALRDPEGTLARAYPPNVVSDNALWAAIDAAFTTQAAFLDAFLNSPPQTNEVRRSAAILPAALVVADHFGLPLSLSELGASAGLNLKLDQYALAIGDQTFGSEDPALTLTPDWSGPLPPTAKINVTDRRGVDLNPLTNAQDTDRLRAYLWADQPDRLALTNAALALPAPQIDRADAASWLEHRLALPHQGTHFVFHTIAWQYFPDTVQSRCRLAIEAAGARATKDAPLVWFSMENDNGAGGKGAALALRLWPGALTLNLGRADFHGRWVDWQYES